MADHPPNDPLRRFDPIIPLAASTIRRARMTIARMVVDPDERADILAMLDLDEDEHTESKEN